MKKTKVKLFKAVKEEVIVVANTSLTCTETTKTSGAFELTNYLAPPQVD